MSTVTPARETAALEAVARFDEAFGRGDVDGVMAAMTDDCVFEDTAPPDGTRHEGQQAVREAWERFFSGTPEPRFEVEWRCAAGDTVTSAWRFTWQGPTPGHIRGIDVFTVRDGRVAVKAAYVKG